MCGRGTIDAEAPCVGGRETMDAEMAFVVLPKWKFLLWRQVETNSDLLLRRFRLFAFKIQNFSSKHKLHLFDPPVYGAAFFTIDQEMLKVLFFSWSCQT